MGLRDRAAQPPDRNAPNRLGERRFTRAQASARQAEQSPGETTSALTQGSAATAVAAPSVAADPALAADPLTGPLGQADPDTDDDQEWFPIEIERAALSADFASLVAEERAAYRTAITELTG